ncbi:hypothetical protein LOTGIDRAFT_168997 [Lottia gigantea]|uniref:Uncharacterized protein n=1 Tax=Lottia gigantea TaxID=225164 RepID=V3ZMT7_LOTGI|nr:hypothetical protein LOTGIDRAFT_168997 [Lottia gigantea]ESO83760.1 hypothetical protein LOTGIDRAFT_168997 [Lottia gigantea]
MYLVLFIVSVLWSTSSSLPVSDGGLSPEFIKEENRTLTILEKETRETGDPFEGVWKKSILETFYKEFKAHEGFDSKNLSKVYRFPEILNLGEIRILICYCFKEPPFFRDLNTDLRDNGGKKYPAATEVLNLAISKLMKHQIGTNQSLPGILFRNEPDFLFSVYQELLNKSENGVLKQFTSTSRSYEKAKKFVTGPGRMIIKLEDPRLGADVDDFSIFDEFEVLLPVAGVYTVQKATRGQNNTFDVVLSGPRSSGNIKPSCNILIIFLSAFIIKFI